MLRHRSNWLLTVGVFGALVSAGGGALARTVYVQSAVATLRAEPKLDGAALAQVKRGERLEVVGEQGIWLATPMDERTAWISSLAVSDFPPIGKADLAADKGLAAEKVSRKRASSYTVSASARGLVSSQRTREGREAYPSDYDTLSAFEKYQVPDAKLNQFEKAGLLNSEK